MADRTVVDLIEDWQTGAFLVIAAAVAGFVLGYLLRSVAPPYGGVLGFIVGVGLGFLVLSYLLYGR